MTYKTINLKLDSTLATLSLNRPEVHNAMNATMMQEIISAIELAGKNPDIRIVIINGEGPSFCAGADLNMMKNSANQTTDENKTEARLLNRMYKTINECSKPVLGVIHGYAIGGGFGLCTVCDIVIADEKTIFSLSEVLIGIIPAVIGPYTERKIGNSWWRALGISGERFDAPFAEKIGLVHYSVPKIEMDNMIKHVIQQLMKGGPISQSIFKEYIRNMDQLNSTDVIANVRSSPEGQEGLAAFLEKRKPNWNQK
ncbi:MAG: hypothetical protein HOB40_01185 [Candidatus Marinimicrobia bacterium]|jgi:methylglutaconyl-CoA hydratase|nr:hypothetical protein [Candidatus Neomarinimicrobiota bacterium]MBT3502305.1 hypothetical protein [Candidatus Neomarinimicrobiota bacterium]MBT3840413.1 hypothetical protein [Candidatus Neomarinimicrobiota bacterium]MBT3999478.1 hypothetical protein [Candidatus Neomarinimicrobiota bacterium]MBT4282071.1 hypothetical protein [Candidatus Neomarinimicrobiota bacterium]